MNKKALNQPIMIITSFAILTIMFIFTSLLIFEAGDEYVITTEQNIAIGILNDTDLPASQGIDTVNTLASNYRAFAFPYDLFFLLMLISTFSFTIYSTFQTTKEGIMSFFGFLFIGSMFMLLITSYLAEFTSWFMQYIFYGVFDDISLNIPILTWYLGNLGLINFIWWIILILVSVIDRNFISRTGEVQE